MVFVFASLAFAFSWVTVAWVWIGAFLILAQDCGKRPKLWIAVWVVLKYPSLVGCFGNTIGEILLGYPVKPVDWFLNGLSVIFWYYTRNNHDDDDFKKWLKKLAGKVAEIGGKLIVVPEPA